MQFTKEQLKLVASVGSVSSHAHADSESTVFLMCLEPGAKPAPGSTAFERGINAVVEAMQPSPGILHVELCFAPDGSGNANFATYLGNCAGWGKSFGNQRSFYLGNNASSWRAVPVVARGASERVRQECGHHISTCYSISRYLTSVPPFRALAGLLPDNVGSPAHCATLSARILKRAVPQIELRHPSAWYSPATLFLELDSESARLAAREELAQTTQAVRARVEEEEEADAMHSLLKGSDDEVAALTTEACSRAVHALATRAIDEGLDETTRRLVQRQLATALLRSAVVRD